MSEPVDEPVSPPVGPVAGGAVHLAGRCRVLAALFIVLANGKAEKPDVTSSFLSTSRHRPSSARPSTARPFDLAAARAVGWCSTSSSRRACRARPSIPSWWRSPRSKPASPTAPSCTPIIKDDPDDAVAKWFADAWRRLADRQGRRRRDRHRVRRGHRCPRHGSSIRRASLSIAFRRRSPPTFLADRTATLAPGLRMTRSLKSWPSWVLLVLRRRRAARGRSIARCRCRGRRRSASKTSAAAWRARSATARACSSRATPTRRRSAIEIARQVDTGTVSDDQIINYIEQRFGSKVLLVPRATGIDALVWALPAAALVCAVVGLGVAFRRWKTAGRHDPRRCRPATRRGGPRQR